ncbi:hypothetical protein BC629DRAFT_201623 [Irpex lacteus]|nr:hypothetical protein BC629DRAFT_201623 [Irpex lacteus]
MSSKSSRITLDGMEYHTFMKLTNGYIQKDNTGVIIPQMIYSLIDDPAANKWFAQSRLPPIHFTLDHSDKVGVRLSHLLKASVAQPLSSKSQPTMRAPSMPIAGVVICWPGQAPWISTLAKSVVLGFQGGMVMPELGECIAKKIAEFEGT